MYNKDNNILEYNHGEKSMKVPFIIYADMESLLEKRVLIIVILKNHQEEQFKGQFKCLGENTGKYITFSVPFKIELDNSERVTY